MSKTCERCGTPGLTWKGKPGSWRLTNPDGSQHRCTSRGRFVELIDNDDTVIILSQAWWQARAALESMEPWRRLLAQAVGGLEALGRKPLPRAPTQAEVDDAMARIHSVTRRNAAADRPEPARTMTALDAKFLKRGEALALMVDALGADAVSSADLHVRVRDRLPSGKIAPNRQSISRYLICNSKLFRRNGDLWEAVPPPTD